MTKSCLSLLCLVLLSLPLSAQEPWDLERCVREALANNLSIRQAKLSKEGFDISGKQLRMEQLPSLNANSNFGVNFGRVVNPATNDFITENSLYQSIGVNAGVMVFNGFRLRNSIRQNHLNTNAAAEDIRQSENDIALSVALAYLNVLFAYENLAIAENRVALSRQQLDNLDKMIQAGTKPENDRYDILSQIAIDEQSAITARNNIEINLLSLKQQMFLEPAAPLDIVRPVIDVATLEALENETFESVYTAALSSQPQIQAAELRQKANELGIPIARSQMMPALSVGANIGSNWSDFAKQVSGTTLLRVPQDGIYIDGELADFAVETEVPTGITDIPYWRQLDNNIGYGIGASLSIPIFNNYSGKASVERAKINVISAGIQTEQIKQTLKTNIQNALTSAKAARQSLTGAEASALAARIALENADRRVALGTLGNFEYLSARNRYDTAESNLLIARYDYFFRIKVIEYYMGRGIRLN